ncbi:MAG: hypothetical protein U0804_24750 [Gemmataceae bacterium]
MTDPDDDWGDLARELGVQKPTASAADASPPEEVEEPEAIHELHASPPEVEPVFGEGIADEAAEGEPEGEGEAEDGSGDKQPGDGRKRRRRRRRRKKGDGDAADAGIADEPAPSYQATGRAPVAVAAPVAEPAGDEADGDDGEVGGGVVSPAEEDTAGEVLRELIATWNVPSWDEIISGLHR